MLKKGLVSLAALIAISTVADARPSDFSYKKSNIKSYMFGIYGGGTYSDLTEEFAMEGGINTYFIYDVTERFNIGARGALKYTTEDQLPVYESYKAELEGFVGFKATPNVNVYAGYGAEAWSEIETDYLLVGTDYFFSEDLMFEFKYKRKNLTQFDDAEAANTFQINAVIPFNWYKI